MDMHTSPRFSYTNTHPNTPTVYINPSVESQPCQQYLEHRLCHMFGTPIAWGRRHWGDGGPHDAFEKASCRRWQRLVGAKKDP